MKGEKEKFPPSVTIPRDVKLVSAFDLLREQQWCHGRESLGDPEEEEPGMDGTELEVKESGRK